MKIVERPEYVYRFVCIWVGMFADEAELNRRALEVLAPAYEERDYDFASAIEIGLGPSSSLAALLGDDFGHQTFDRSAVVTRAKQVLTGPVNGMVLVNHARCEAGPYDFPGFVFLGNFPSRENPEMI